MKKILLVDDNRHFLHSFALIIRSYFENYELLTAENGQQAIALLESNSVSVILTDIEMPYVDGFGVMEYAKQNCPDVPIIIMTGSWSLDLEFLVEKTGVVACLEKPFLPSKAIQVLEEALEDQKEQVTLSSSSQLV